MIEQKKTTSSNFDFWSKSWPVDDKPLSINIGDLSLTISRSDYEWKLNYRWQKLGNEGAFNCDFLAKKPEEYTNTDRVAMESMSQSLTISPKLADRPVVTRPYSPLIIPGKNRIVLRVSTPLWISVNFSGDVSREFPVIKLSDTWMGQPSGAGELCYGAFTHAQLDEKLLLKLPYRALTPVTLHNTGDKMLTLERLSIPAPYLTLYEGATQLVTEPITIEVDPINLTSNAHIGKLTGNAQVAAPRLKSDGVLANTFQNLFA